MIDGSHFFAKSEEVLWNEEVTELLVSLGVRRLRDSELIGGVTRQASIIVTKCQTLF